MSAPQLSPSETVVFPISVYWEERPFQRPVLRFPRSRPPIDRNEPSDFGEEIPYYDEELEVSQRPVHKEAVSYFEIVLGSIGERLGLRLHSDFPIRYRDHRTGAQKQFYPDLALVKKETPENVTAHDLLLSMEVVTIGHKLKREKDTITMRDMNEHNGVPEFILFFPELEDERSLVWYRMDQSGYREVSPDREGFYQSQAVPGLRMRILPRDQWQPGRKVETFLDTERFDDYKQVRSDWMEAEQRAETAERRA